MLSLKKLSLSLIFLLALSLPVFAKDLTVSYIDIGQGDSELVELPNGKNILIDAGDRDGSANLTTYLKQRKIKKLDLIIISHPHLDHYGGLIKTLKDIKDLEISEVFDSGAKTSSSTYAKLLKQFFEKKAKLKMPRKGDTFNYDGVNLKILAPQDPLLKNTKSDINNSSIVAKLSYGSVSFLFTGDMEEASQNQILSEEASELKANILKVAHHGSRYTTSNEFLDAVKAELAVISCGQGNSYNHPHKEALVRLNKKKIPFYRTDLNGTVVVTTDGKTYKVSTQKGGKSATSEGSSKTEKIDLNKADQDQLDVLQGINPDKVAKIVSLRPIKTWGDLKKAGLTDSDIDTLKEQVFLKEKKTSSSNSSKGKKDLGDEKINVNTASVAELSRLAGVGKVTAEKIIKGRPYSSVDDLGKVMGKKKAEKLINNIEF